jgi:hypothetical protein
MSTRIYLWGLGILSAICWFGFFIILVSANPYKADILTFTSFFALLFLGLAFLLAIIGFWIRFIILRENISRSAFKVSFRQGILISLSIIGLLLLQAIRILTVYDGVLLVSAILMLEFFFRAKY